MSSCWTLTLTLTTHGGQGLLRMQFAEHVKSLVVDLWFSVLVEWLGGFIDLVLFMCVLLSALWTSFSDSLEIQIDFSQTWKGC